MYSYLKASSASPALAENFLSPIATNLVLSSTPMIFTVEVVDSSELLLKVGL
jgi:hypothetical protein